jgi:hypothetical protein
MGVQCAEWQHRARPDSTATSATGACAARPRMVMIRLPLGLRSTRSFLSAMAVAVGVVPAPTAPGHAHLRKVKRGEADIVVRAKPDVSGRFKRCIPIAEWRRGAYRVRQEVLDVWGGLSVKDGFIQRSAAPPAFNRPGQFLAWLQKQRVELVSRNN